MDEAGPSTRDGLRLTVHDLPPELMLHIFSFVDTATLVRLRRVCSTWRSLAEDNALWRKLVTGTFERCGHQINGNSDLRPAAELHLASVVSRHFQAVMAANPDLAARRPDLDRPLPPLLAAPAERARSSVARHHESEESSASRSSSDANSWVDVAGLVMTSRQVRSLSDREAPRGPHPPITSTEHNPQQFFINHTLPEEAMGDLLAPVAMVSQAQTQDRPLLSAEIVAQFVPTPGLNSVYRAVDAMAIKSEDALVAWRTKLREERFGELFALVFSVIMLASSVFECVAIVLLADGIVDWSWRVLVPIAVFYALLLLTIPFDVGSKSPGGACFMAWMVVWTLLAVVTFCCRGDNVVVGEWTPHSVYLPLNAALLPIELYWGMISGAMLVEAFRSRLRGLAIRVYYVFTGGAMLIPLSFLIQWQIEFPGSKVTSWWHALTPLIVAVWMFAPTSTFVLLLDAAVLQLPIATDGVLSFVGCMGAMSIYGGIFVTVATNSLHNNQTLAWAFFPVFFIQLYSLVAIGLMSFESRAFYGCCPRPCIPLWRTSHLGDGSCCQPPVTPPASILPRSAAWAAVATSLDRLAVANRPASARYASDSASLSDVV
ncbi:uncharacterized protein AMSG_03167 [Thecamonas trahens ATCC 50062]|uniref:F-box domain-containing protein n=1 Tax=Thecamonas trahens ATCC 50062 TaxID=461836 RepID=A0A0L0D354_THETB|nr:hypothetical protein AMSG_03167 [Thecamonas trahens ATCC 50062]KNC46739.1 hypothetical protein AMSG_03167 [Thecamonas trahens ATCC 50062]|eukprot:XP_013760019.1 hypothetical protein AMSG_03167 [Thecamonas trahens ATCC 50062]